MRHCKSIAFVIICFLLLAFGASSKPVNSRPNKLPFIDIAHTADNFFYQLEPVSGLSSKYWNYFALPTVSFDINHSEVVESSEPNVVTIAVTLSAPSSVTVTVPYSISAFSTANGSDYTIGSGTSPIIFNPGETKKFVTVNVKNNLPYQESAETVIFNLGTPSNATLGAITTHTLTIYEDYSSVKQDVSFISSGNAQLENITTAKVKVLLFQNLFNLLSNVDVDYTIGGTAIRGIDYEITNEPNNKKIRFNSNTASQEFDFDLIIYNDNLKENDETIIFTITNANGGNTLVTPIPQFIYTIVDDDNDPLLTSPLSDTRCSNQLFNYTPTSRAGTTFTWKRDVVPGISNPATNGNGNISETLINTTSNPVNVIYEYTLTNLTKVNKQNVVLTVNPTPVLTSALNPATTASNSVFNYTPVSSTANTTFTWTRAAIAGISNAAGSGTGNISETLVNTTTSPVNVKYTYILTANGCTSSSYDVTVTVDPPPIVNQPPNATNVLNFPIQNISGVVNILPLSGYDSDGSISQFKIESLPVQGKLLLNGVQITTLRTLTPAEAKNLQYDVTGVPAGNVIFRFSVKDNGGLSSGTPYAIFTIPVKTNSVSSICTNSQLGPNLLGASGTFSKPYITPNSKITSVNDGSNIAAPLENLGNPQPSLTNYVYADQCGALGPEGRYAFLKTVGLPSTSSRNCIKGDWIASDHTGDNGYFMIINGAAPSASVGKTFYNANSITVCPNTMYEFSAWVLNVLPGNSSAAAAGSEPNISFYINGQHVSTSGSIAYSTAATNYVPQWVKVGGLWYSGPNPPANITLRIDNATNVASGNDLALDDISMAICGLDITYPQSGLDPTYCSYGTLPLQATVKSSINTYSYYIFQRKKPGETTWTNISSPKQGNPVYDGTNYVYDAVYGDIPIDITMNGDKYRVKVATDPTNLIGEDCSISADKEITVNAFEQTVAPPDLSICDGSTTADITAAKPTENWRFLSGPTGVTATITNAGHIAGMTARGVYKFELYNSAGCKSTTTITRDQTGNAGNDGSICSFQSTYDLGDAGTAYRWEAKPGNPANVTLNSAKGDISGMTVNGDYYFILKSDYAGCTDEVKVTRAVCPAISINIKPFDAVKKEGTGGGTTPFFFRVSRDPGPGGTIDNSSPLTFTYDVIPLSASPTNANNVDFPAGYPSGSSTIPTGSDYIDIFIPVNQDNTPEFDESFTVQIHTSGINISTDKADGLIIDDDTAIPIVSFEVASSQKRENDVTDALVNIKLSAPAATYTKVYFSTSPGVAVLNNDYTFPVGSAGTNNYVEFFPGQSVVSVVLDMVNDGVQEPTETVTFQLTNVDNNKATIGSIPVHVLNILDDDHTPEAHDDEYKITECATSLTGTVAGPVLNPDFDADGDALSFRIKGGYDTSKGAITIQPNGDFTFLPTPGQRFEGPLYITYEVSDGNQTDEGVLTINNQYPFLLVANTVNDQQCFGARNATISVHPTGGSGNYTYQWQDDASNTSQNRTSLGAGIYYVNVTDATQGCSTGWVPVVVTEKPKIVFDYIKGDVSCYDGNDGAIITNVSGGSGSFTYLWTGPNNYTSNLPNPIGLKAGDYHLELRDAEVDCGIIPGNVTITQFPPITNNQISGTSSSCGTAASELLTGSIPAGGSGSYSYQWQISTDGVSYSDLAGETNQDYIHPVLTATTYYQRLVYSGTCVDPSVSNIFKFTVNPVPDISADHITQTICSGTSTGVTFSNPNNVSGTTYSWTVVPNSNVTGSSNGTGSTLSQNLTNTSNTPQIVDYTVTPATASCPGSPTIVTITVNPTATVNTVSDQTLCDQSPSTAVSFSSPVSGTTYAWTNDLPSIGLGANGTGDLASFTASNTSSAPVTAHITVTPTANNCTGTPLTFTITVNPTATVNAVSNQTLCDQSPSTAVSFSSPVSGTTYAWTNDLPSIGLGANGTGDLASFTASNTSSAPVTAHITVTPTANNCTGTPLTFTITVNPTATVNAVSNQTLCDQSPSTAVSFSSQVSGTTYAWTNDLPSIGLGANGTGDLASFTASNTSSAPVTAHITVTPTANNCTGTPLTFTITVNPTATVNAVSNQTLCDQSPSTAVSFSSPVSGTTYAWTNDLPSIGLGANGTGDLASFTASNTSSAPVTAHITVTPTANNCTGTPLTFTITVNPTATVNAVVIRHCVIRVQARRSALAAR